ncbi:hypothetical protein D3C83_68810 [compost metagenome]
MRSTLKPAICFLKPPAGSSTSSGGTYTFSKKIGAQFAPDMNLDGLPIEKPSALRRSSTEPMPSTPGP